MDISTRELLDAEVTIKAHAAALSAIQNSIERGQFDVCVLYLLLQTHSHLETESFLLMLYFRSSFSLVDHRT